LLELLAEGGERDRELVPAGERLRAPTRVDDQSGVVTARRLERDRGGRLKPATDRDAELRLQDLLLGPARDGGDRSSCSLHSRPRYSKEDCGSRETGRRVEGEAG
jgi:hypothetical protein